MRNLVNYSGVGASREIESRNGRIDRARAHKINKHMLVYIYIYIYIYIYLCVCMYIHNVYIVYIYIQKEKMHFS